MASVPPLDSRWLWEPVAESTEAGIKIAKKVATEPLSTTDLDSIISAATLRLRFSWLTPDAANARIKTLESAIATMKLRLHSAEVETERAKSELAVCRNALKSQ